MADIYHALVKHSLADCPTDSLQEYGDNCASAVMAINSALALIGNLTLEASQSEDYTASEAKRDLFHLGSVLRYLPRVAQALEHNSDLAEHEMRLRKGKKGSGNDARA